MSIIPPRARINDYPTSDGKPVAETDWHRELMFALITTLRRHFLAQPEVYVSGNLLVYYEEGNRRRHVSPDVFVVRGVGSHERPNYLVWQEGRGPEMVIELTSSTTRREDMTTKRRLYQDTLRVREYYLFDPRGDYLDPPMQGYRLRQGTYRPIRAVRGRLPSQVLGLHLERAGQVLRLWEPAAEAWLPTPAEAVEQAVQRAEHIEQLARQAEQSARQAEQHAQQAEQQAQQAEEHALREAERARLAEQHALQAEQQAEQAEQRAERAEEELLRLRAELQALRGRPREQE